MNTATLLDDPTAAASPVARFDLYRDIHKALRAALCDALVSVGRADAHDAEDRAAALAEVRDLLALCSAHVDKEERFVHPVIDACSSGASARIAHEHAEHLQAIADLEEDVRVVEVATAESRASALLRLYRHLSLFVAANLEHMMVEETTHNAILWAHHDDAGLQAIEGRILASIAPPDMAAVLRWMVPAIDADARAALFLGMRRVVPEQAFAAVLASGRATLSACDAGKLERALAAG